VTTRSGGVGEGVEDLAGAGDEGGLAAGGAGAGDVPGVGGDQQDVGGVDPEAGGGHAVGLGGRLEAVDGVGRQHRLEGVDDAGVLELGPGHPLGRVGQGGQAQAALGQAAQGGRDLRVGGKAGHAAHDRLAVVVGQLDPQPGRGHVQGGPPDGAEVGVAVGDGGHHGRLEQLAEPGHPGPAVAEQPLELAVEGGQVEQRLVDVEQAHRRHGVLLADGPPAGSTPGRPADGNPPAGVPG
jgi:hypothetical protein